MTTFLTILVAYLLSMVSTGSDLATQKIQQAKQYLRQDSTAQKILPSEEFKAHLMQGNYQQCMELIRRAQATPTQEHFDIALKLASIEADPNHKKDALACAKFIHHDLVDRGIIQPEQKCTRGIEEFMAELKRDAQGPQGQFLKAVQANDVTKMQAWLARGAQPDLSSNCLKPAQLAIARGHQEALDALYRAGVQPTAEHLSQAETQKFLWTSNQAEDYSDIVFTTTDQSTGYAEAIKRCQDLCDFITRKLSPAPTRRN